MKKPLGKKLYSLSESFIHLLKGFLVIPYLGKAKRRNQISDKFQERIMLAVTSVNGCAMCSYAHTQMALESGLSKDEIRQLLDSDDRDNIPADELDAIMFASYYAEKRGKVDKNIWKKIVDEYGKPKALGILGAIRVITLGNIYGIAAGSFISRFKKDKSQRDDRTTISYELLILLFLIPFFLISFVISLIFRVFRLKLI